MAYQTTRQLQTQEERYQDYIKKVLRQLDYLIKTQSLNIGSFVSTNGSRLIWDASGGGGGTWGGITGTLSDQTDLQNALNLKLNISSFVPAGANTQVQFNNSGVFGASANLTWDGTSLITGASATVARLSVKGDGVNPIANFEGTTTSNGWQIDAAGTSLLPKTNSTHFLGGTSAILSTIFATAMRTGASSNWHIGGITGGFSGYFRVQQNHDYNAQPATWMFDYSSSFGNTSTSGTGAHVSIIGNFKPTSGTAVYSDFAITSVINQTGGANGQTRGVYVNPTLTAVGNSLYRAFESTAGQVKIADTTVAGSAALAGSLLDLTQTWNTSGSPTAIKLNVTDTASNASSLLMDLQIGGTTKLNVSKTGSITSAGGLAVASDIQLGNVSQLVWASSTKLHSPSNGVFVMWNAAQTDFSRLQFGGTTSAFPALKRVGTTLEVRLADDSAATGFATGALATAGSITLAAGTELRFDAKSRISSGTDGNIILQNAAQSSFGLLQFGGTTSSFPALKRSSTELQVRLSDDSAPAPFNAGNITSSGFLSLGSGARIYSQSSDTFLLINSAFTDFNRLNFGGTTNLFPSLKRLGANLIARLADDSANTDIEVLDEAYGVGWNGSNEVPTKNAVYDKIQTLGYAAGAFVTTDLPYTVLTTDLIINANDGSPDTITLPTAVGATGKIYQIKNSDIGVITIDGNGSETIDGSTTLKIHPLEAVQIASDGANWIVTSYPSKSGTYTPTVTASANTDAAVTATQAQYMRVGKMVTVTGRFTADPTAAAVATSFEMSLPIASNLGAAEDLAGVAFCGSVSGMGAEIFALAANDTARVSWVASDITSQTWSYTYSYEII